MKWKLKIFIGLSLFLSFFGLLSFVALFVADEPKTVASIELESKGSSLSVSQEVLKHRELVEKYAKKETIEQYIPILLAIMQVESGGTMKDVMQSSESKGLPPNTITDPEESIAQGFHYFAELVRSAESLGVDQQSVIQAYNYGGGFLNYIAKHEKKNTHLY